MKKRLFLVNYSFTTGGHEYNNSRHVTMKFDKSMDDEQGRKIAEQGFTDWYNSQGYDGVLDSVVASTALELMYYPEHGKVTRRNSGVDAIAARSLRHETLPDSIDVEVLTFDQIEQMIFLQAEFTDTLLLKNQPPSEWIEELQKRGFYVNTMQDLDTKTDFYTVICWK